MERRQETLRKLEEHGIKLTAQRIAVAESVLFRKDHPTADEVYRSVRATLPMISKATVYNTLNLLVAKRLLRALTLHEGSMRYDPLLVPHHHFIDTRTRRVVDLTASQVPALDVRLDDERFQVDAVQITFHGRLREAPAELVVD